MFLVSAALVSAPVYANYTKLSVPNIIDEALAPGSTFSIDVNVSNVENLWGYSVVLSYDTSILTATAYHSYDPFTQAGPSRINDTGGWAYLYFTMPMGTEVGFTGNGSLASIDFTVDARGMSKLDLHDTKLASTTGEKISHNTVDGYFINVEGLLTKYHELLTDYHALNATYYSLLAEYGSLLAECETLNSMYNSLLAGYNDFLAEYGILNSTYYSLLAEYDELMGENDVWASDYDALLTNYENLRTTYNSLNSTYNSLKADRDSLESKYDVSANELSTARNLNYLLAATTLVFIVTSAYLILRKPKTRA